MALLWSQVNFDAVHLLSGVVSEIPWGLGAAVVTRFLSILELICSPFDEVYGREVLQHKAGRDRSRRWARGSRRNRRASLATTRRGRWMNGVVVIYKDVIDHGDRSGIVANKPRPQIPQRSENIARNRLTTS